MEHVTRVQDYEAILDTDPGHPRALLNSAKVHVALRNVEEATTSLKHLLTSASLTADLAPVLEASQLLTALQDGTICSGAKLIPFPSLPASTPKAPAPSPATPPPVQTTSSGVQTESEAVLTPPAVIAPASTPKVNGTPSGNIHKGATASPVPIDSMHRLLAISQPNAAVGVAVELVNSGKCAEAIAVLDLLEERHGANVGAYAARGTARALLGDLTGAVTDFGAAIAMEPRYHDFYKRRAQALAALGQEAGAVRDLRQAVQLSPDPPSKADAYSELAKVYQKRKDHPRAEEAARAGLALDPGRKALLSLLASSQLTQGDLEVGAATYVAVLEGEGDSADAALGAGMAYKELCKVEQALKVCPT
jgi:Flp pilus assembly protein TadD